MNDETFINTIKGHEGIEIKLFLSDGRQVDGTLLNIQKDYISLDLEEITYYFPVDQVRALSKNAKDSKLLLSQTFVNSEQSFQEVLEELYLHWVTINSFNQLTFSGILSQITNDHVMLINDEKQYFILKSQIVSIFKGRNEEQQSSETEEKQNSTEMTEQNKKSNEKEQQSNEMKEGEEVQQTNETDKEDIQQSPNEQVEASQLSETKEENVNEQQETINKNSNTPVNNDSPIKKEKPIHRKKTHELFQIKQVKFDSPIDECTWNSVQESNEKIFDGEQKINPSPIEEISSLKMEEESDSSPKDNLPYPDEEESKMIMEDNQELIERQYYALMKFAENMNSLEKQYQTLMKHAKKMYLQLKNKRRK